MIRLLMQSIPHKAGAIPLGIAAAILLIQCSAGSSTGKVAPGKTGPTASGADALARKIWKGFDQMRNTCGGFNYHPTGGMRTIYCHAKTLTNYVEIASLSGLEVWKSGPHSNEFLNLTSSDYGHYNRKFVQLLPKVLLPGKQDKAFRAATQGMYNKHLRNLARIHYVTYRKWQSKPNLRRVELLAYQEYQRKQAVGSDNNEDPNKYSGAFYERFYFFMDRRYSPPRPGKPVWQRGLGDGGYGGNVVKTAAAWWLRRYLDGSVYDFARGLKQLLETYDAAWLRKQGG